MEKNNYKKGFDAIRLAVILELITDLFLILSVSSIFNTALNTIVMIITAGIGLISFVLLFSGLNYLKKEHENYISALAIVVLSFVVQMVVVVFEFVNPEHSFIPYLQTFVDIGEILAVAYICSGTKQVLKDKKITTVSTKTTKIIVAFVISYLASKITISYITSAVTVVYMQIPALVACAISLIIIAMAYIWYLTFLENAKNALQ